ncbi:GNAT family N-acetyltransferase [Paenibacillus etheri]|uniref:Spermidine acetyltransferase n=1 Tax=Paenibacillus etheri TaxID=1306852 RepID=A0A0W1B578_9BACL|nr:GNAT family N-acetyltransferase [Paenibacillus etheri]KTD88685.1 spermidine acetyltransferase [Paenibacillus etheri]
MSTIRITPVTEENNSAVLALKVSENQKTYIETPEQCLQEAYECPYYKPVGLYYDDELVGFAMYGWFPEYDDGNSEGRVWLDRFLIDERYQGQGFGRLMLQSLLAHLASEYQCNKIFLSIYDNNEHALRLYKKFGFKYNGELDFNGEKVMVLDLLTR